MDIAVETGLVGLAGVALGLAGNAAIEIVRRTASRRDAAAERQAAVLREIQDVLDDFNRQWTELLGAIREGKADLSTQPVTSAPAVVANRFMTLTRRVQNDGLRRELQEVSGLAYQLAASGAGGAELTRRVPQVQNHIGEVLRSLQ